MYVYQLVAGILLLMPKKINQLCDQDPVFRFSSKLAEAMAITEDSVKTVVDKTGIPNSTIRSYLNGEIEPGIGPIIKIARGMGFKAGWFLGDEDDSLPPKEIISDAEKDLELLNDLFRYMKPAQRSRVLKRVLASVSRQLDHVADNDDSAK